MAPECEVIRMRAVRVWLLDSVPPKKGLLVIVWLLEPSNLFRTKGVRLYSFGGRFFVGMSHTVVRFPGAEACTLREMNMEDLLGIAAGDFEGVDFAASSESEDEEEPSDSTSAPAVDAEAAAVPLSDTKNSNAQRAPPTAGPPPSDVTTILQVGRGRRSAR